MTDPTPPATNRPVADGAPGTRPADRAGTTGPAGTAARTMPSDPAADRGPGRGADRSDRSDGARPLTGAQAGIWYAQQRDPGNPAYNCAEYVELTGPLDADRLADAVRRTVAESDTLRLRYREAGDGARPVAFLCQDADGLPPLRRVDTAAHVDPYASAVAWMRDDLLRPYDLTTGPVFRHALISLADEHHLWYLACHHIALDGYGFGLVQQRVAELYTAAVRGAPAPAVRFCGLGELLAEEEDYRASPRFARDREHWRQAVAGAAEPVCLATHRGAVGGLPTSAGPSAAGRADVCPSTQDGGGPGAPLPADGAAGRAVGTSGHAAGAAVGGASVSGAGTGQAPDARPGPPYGVSPGGTSPAPDFLRAHGPLPEAVSAPGAAGTGAAGDDGGGGTPGPGAADRSRGIGRTEAADAEPTGATDRTGPTADAGAGATTDVTDGAGQGDGAGHPSDRNAASARGDRVDRNVRAGGSTSGGPDRPSGPHRSAASGARGRTGAPDARGLPASPAGSDSPADSGSSADSDSPRLPASPGGAGRTDPLDPLDPLEGTRPETRLAAVAGYLHRVTGRRDIVLGLPFAGRFGSVAARIPASTVNVLPLPLDITPDMTPRQLVAQVARRLRAVRRHGRYRGEDVRRDLRLPADRRLTGPLVNVGLTAPELRLAGLRARVHHLSAGPVDDLTVTFRDHREQPAAEQPAPGPYPVAAEPAASRSYPAGAEAPAPEPPAARPSAANGTAPRDPSPPAGTDAPRAGTAPQVGTDAPRDAAAPRPTEAPGAHPTSTLTVDGNPTLYRAEEVAAHHRRLRDFLVAFARSPHQPLGLLVPVADDERAAVPELAAAEVRAAAGPGADQGVDDPRLIDPAVPAPEFDLCRTDLRELVVRDLGPAGPGPTLPELFRRQVRAKRDAVAVTAGDVRLTYRELDERANRLAHELRARGVGREDLVALVLPRSAHLVVAVLGVLAAGAGYVPLDPRQPPARTAAVLAAARPALLLTDADHALSCRGEAPLLRLDAPEVRAACARRPATPPEVPGAGDGDCAYVIHTSGSTGEPKGVVVEHRNVARLLAATEPYFRFGPDDTWTLFHSYAFDFSVWELFGALLHGGRLVVVDHQVSRAPAELLRLLARERVTVLNQTPTAFQQLALADRAEPGFGPRLALRHLILGGEPLQPRTLADWYLRHAEDAPRITNMYGITETTVHVTHRVLEGADARQDATGLIGEPLPDLRVRLLDEALSPVAPGAVGEVYVAGAGLARGYLGRPALTADRFLPDPYGPPGSRMYRSGDLARRDRWGRLDHLGRADQQVKVRGFRIEPGEVEAALLGHPDVARAAVVARDDPGVGRRLVGYVVPAPGADPDPAAVRRHVAGLLPDAMVPARVVVLAALPRTENGKLDRAALPAPVPGTRGAGPASGPPAAGPRTQLLCELFADLLELDRVEPHDDFFALGGHSLLATRLVGRVRDALDAAVGVRDLFEAPTPAGLAARLTTVGVPRPRLGAGPRREREPLSYAQLRLWFLHRMEGPSPTYNIPFALRLTGRLDTAALRAALADLVARHETLRTVFPAGEPAGVPAGSPGAAPTGAAGPPADRQTGDGLHQRVLPPEQAVPELPVTDVAVDRLDAELAAAVRYAFDLAGQPPLRARLLRIAPDDHVLLLVLHHTAADDWSLGPLAADLADGYAARLRGGAPERPPLPVRYADYARWQAGLLSADGALARTQLAYWKDRLADLPDQLELPTDRRRPAVPSHRGGTVPVRVDAGLHRALRALARRYGVTVFMVLQAGLAALLTRLGAGTDIPLGSPVAGRTDPALDDLVGFFANTLVLRTDTSGDPDFATLLARVRETDLAAFDHQDVPFDRLVEEVRPARSPSRHPLFQVMLSYGAARPAPSLPGLEARPVRVHNGSAKFDLTLALGDAPDGEGIEGFLEYAVDLFDADTARGLAERLLRLLGQAAADPERPLSRYDVLAAAERRRILYEWNDTTAPVDPRAFPQMFEDQARRHPDREALVAGEHRLTYRRLNALANRLAHHLAELGVGPERTVGVHLPRGAEMVVGLLAVEKAGGAFVPLEPSWPGRRIVDIVASARPAVVLTAPGGADALPDGVPAVELDLSRDWFADRPEHDPRVPIAPDGLAYVIYTSGSTGTPKGAMIRHVSISNRLPWQIDLLGLTPDDPVLHKAPLTFDISVNEIFLPLAAGAPLVVADAGREGDVAHLLELIERERVAFVYLVSSLLDIVLERADVARTAASLKHVWCGGEVLTPELFRRFRERLGDATMYHGYGPAETTIGVTCQVYRGGSDRGITIGRPNPNTRVHVLDPAMQPVPVGVPGELYLGGVPLGRGYLNDPRRTAESFVPDPFATEPGARLYRSGDLARYRRDGDIEFLGRVDNQVKVRGARVELEEVEAVLSGHPGVRQAVVLARRDGSGGTYLAAWCTRDRAGDGGGAGRPGQDTAGPAGAAADGSAADGAVGDGSAADGPAPEGSAPGGDTAAGDTADGDVVDGDALLEWLRARLPDAMVPRQCRIVPALPLMTSGKVDRGALAAADDAAPARRTPYVEPRGATERMVAETWAVTLGVDRVGARDNFFDLGGHSLLLARVQTALRARLGWDVPVLDLFTLPTVAALAEHLDRRDGLAPPSASGAGSREALGLLLPLRTGGDLEPLFCVHPASGLSWPFAGLRQHVDARRPLYGIQSRALAGEVPVAGSLDEMVTEYVDRIREVQPHGPYHLLGWSFGGVVGHAMATRLRRAGERVALLAMLDAYPRYPWDRLADDHEQQALRSLLYMAHYDLARLDDTPLTRDRVMAVIAEQGGVLSELTAPTVQGVMDTFVSAAVLQQGARHEEFDGDLLFFTATVNPVDPTLSHRDWKPYVTGTIENHGVACEHKDMTRTGPLTEIGRHLDRRLRDLAE